MTRKSLILLLPLLAICVWGCNSGEKSTIYGKVNNPHSQIMKLWRIDIDTPVLIDSAKIRNNNHFRLSLRSLQPEFYKLGYSDSEFITLLIKPGDRIKLGFMDDKLYRNYIVEGSEESEDISMLEMKLSATKIKIDSLSRIYLADIDDHAGDGKLAETEKLIYDVIMDQRSFSINYILRHLNSMASIVALYQRLNDETYVLYDTRDLQIMKLLSDTLSVKYPGSRQVKALSEDLARELENLKLNQLAKIVNDAEPMVPDPNLVGVDGKRVALSSLRGKYVLLTFWSALSKECIANNLLLKNYYLMYRKKGFEIYQISIDSDEQAWRNAIRFDELPWINVREDDPHNPKFLYLYNIQSLPSNYLYDPKGNIIATNLFGKNLAIKLEQLFGQ